ncbi:MAG: amidohydrolase family protein, partial [Dehalococcoidales bacterium]|nr:amidohydrolase family protein [Dehalococcoidales bacterium]
GILNAMAELNSLGITCVTEPGLSPELIRMYTDLFNRGKFTLRVNCMIMGGSSIEDVKRNLDTVGTSTGFGNEWLRISGYKLFADGIPPSKTAFMYEDYIGGGHGRLLIDGDTDDARYEMLIKMIKYANARNFQIGIHVTGDRGIDACVDGYIAALSEHPWDARHYIIHTDYVTPQCIERMAKNNIGANVQSAIKWTIGNMMIGITGEERAAYHWPLKSLFEAGVNVSNSSDASVTYPDWRQGVESAVLRKDKATGEVIGPEQCITVEQAIRSYTINGAWQDHQDNVRGSIEVGKLADLTIIGDNVLTIDPNKIHDIPIIATIVGGQTVYINPGYTL